MSQFQIPEEITPIGKEILRKFHLGGIEILREDYSATVDFGRELSTPYKTQLERMGFEVIHEEASIYTLRYDYEC